MNINIVSGAFCGAATNVWVLPRLDDLATVVTIAKERHVCAPRYHASEKAKPTCDERGQPDSLPR